MDYLAFVILPYFTIAIFVAGMAYRIHSWARAPMPGAMTLFPAPDGGAATFRGVVKASFLFPGLFRGDRVFWAMAWIFHASLALIIVGHLRVFTVIFDRLFMTGGMTAETISRLSALSGGIAGLVIMAAAMLLIIRRMSTERVREVTNPADYLALALILAILVTGNIMRFDGHFDLAQTRLYFSQMFGFAIADTSIPQNGMFQAHFLLVQLLVIYIPFSKILHFGGIFFTHTLIQKA